MFLDNFVGKSLVFAFQMMLEWWNRGTTKFWYLPQRSCNILLYVN